MPGIDELSFGFVRGRYLAGVADTNDENLAPDFQPMEGKVTFSATASKLRVLSEALGPITVFPRDIVIDLDNEGYLSRNGSRDIALWATDDPDSNPTNWQWKASAVLKFNGIDSSDSTVFELSAGETVDLTTIAPVMDADPGTIITRGLKGDPGDAGASVTVTTVPAASWPPAADADPLHWYVKVP